jgi:hypothetical protein
MNWHTKKTTMKTTIAVAFTLAFAFAVGITPALAVHDRGLFELDRNAIDPTKPASGQANLPDDWDTVNLSGGGSSLTKTGLIVEQEPDLTKFTGGGSKDNNDLNQWQFITGNPTPDKDNITNSYAAAYRDPVSGHLILYFGLDRKANNGSAQVGFWFFQNAIGIDASTGTFTDLHAVGDILVQSNFTQGGTISNISVFKWVGSGGSHGTLDLITQTSADCVLNASAGDNACATVNTGNETAPWTYTPKFGSAGIFPQGSFFEGGIDLAGLGVAVGCFSSFLAETRSSTPFDAVLKDFSGPHAFQTCGIKVTKACSTTNPPHVDTDGVTIISTFDVSVQNNGFSDILDVKLVEDSRCTISGFPVARLGAGLTATGTVVCDARDNPFTNTVTALASSSSTARDDLTDTTTASCPAITPEHRLVLTKDCSASRLVVIGGVVAVEVEVDITVSNPSGPGEEELINVRVTDDKLGTLISGATLVPGETLTFADRTYHPIAPDNNIFDPANASFTDHVDATGTGFLSGVTVNATQKSATCFLCPPITRP